MSISTIIMLIVLIISSLPMVIEDMKRLKIYNWQQLLFIGVAFICFYIHLCLSGYFFWQSLLLIPIYVLLRFINSKLNLGMIFGEADLDVLFAALSIIIVMFLYPSPEGFDNYGVVLGISSMTGAIFWLAIGLMVGIITGIIRTRIVNGSFKNIKKTLIPVVIVFVPMTIYCSLFLF